MRLTRILIFPFLRALEAECEVLLSLLNHLLSPDVAPSWKRAIILEIFTDIFSSETQTRQIFQLYDHQEDKRSVIRDFLASIVRIASEQPGLIGDRRENSIDLRGKSPSTDQPSQGDGIMGTLGNAMGKADIFSLGIGRDVSMSRTRCIDHLDKSDSPDLPSTYIYALVLTSLSVFSEGIASYLLPLTAPTSVKGRRKTRDSTKGEPISSEDRDISNEQIQDNTGERSKAKSDHVRKLSVNPLSLKSHPQYFQVQLSAEMIETCWPALLAATSTFFTANLDSHFYHALIRSFQKFTHVAGLLDFSTIRDAFLTVLANCAAPYFVSRKELSDTRPEDRSGSASSVESGEDHDDLSHEQGTTDPRSLDTATNSLTWRHMLCLRALINLGIALGPSLQKGWSIILLAMQRAETLLYPLGRGNKRHPWSGSRHTEGEDSSNDFGASVAAANTATTRLMVSTGTLPDAAFLSYLDALILLFQPHIEDNGMAEGDHEIRTPPHSASRKRRGLPSLIVDHTEAAQLQSASVLLTFFEQSSRANAWRFVEQHPGSSGWDQSVQFLFMFIASEKIHPRDRKRAAEILHGTMDQAVRSDEFKHLEASKRTEILSRCTYSLRLAIMSIYPGGNRPSKGSSILIITIHRTILEAFHELVEQSGEDFGHSWEFGLSLIETPFIQLQKIRDPYSVDVPVVLPADSSLMRVSFNTLELICSDYLAQIHPAHTRKFVDLLELFTNQTEDLNMSLTCITFYRRIADFLRTEVDSMRLPSLLGQDEVDFGDLIERHDLTCFTPVLWVYLQVSLTDVVTDNRMEIRHSAVQTVLRILNDSDDTFTPMDWRICYVRILEKLLALTILHRREMGHSDEEWRKTIPLVIDGVSDILAQNLDLLRSDESFVKTWQRLLYWLRTAFEFQESQPSVYAGLATIMAKVPSPDYLSPQALDQVWHFWQFAKPAETRHDQYAVQDIAIKAYLQTYRHIARLATDLDHVKRVISTLANLYQCLRVEEFASPAVGRDRTTETQNQVIDSIKLIPSNDEATSRYVMDMLAKFMLLAYNLDKHQMHKATSYSALSKAVMSILEELNVKQQIGRSNEFHRASILVTIGSLTVSLKWKYKWPKNENRPYIWMTATSAALNILESKKAILSSQSTAEKTCQSRLWKALVELLQGILHAQPLDCPWATNIPEDEQFDIDHFQRLHKLLAPLLGFPSCPETMRRSYINSLFQNSLIHQPNEHDLPSSPDNHPLENLCSEHIGRVMDLQPSLRSNLCYTLLNTLFSLVAIHDDGDDGDDGERSSTTTSDEQQRLTIAKAAAPYVTLRVGLTLKAYVKDQPLRGCCPQPISQKRELWRILEMLVDLDSEPRAFVEDGLAAELDLEIPERGDGGRRRRKRKKSHLRGLFGLVRQAMKVATWSKDQKTYEALDRVMVAYDGDMQA